MESFVACSEVVPTLSNENLQGTSEYDSDTARQPDLRLVGVFKLSSNTPVRPMRSQQWKSQTCGT